jgi:hypothetical protein
MTWGSDISPSSHSDVFCCSSSRVLQHAAGVDEHSWLGNRGFGLPEAALNLPVEGTLSRSCESSLRKTAASNRRIL